MTVEEPSRAATWLHSAWGDSSRKFVFVLVRVVATSALTYKRNNEAIMNNHCRPGKAISITYSECVSVALGIQNATHIGYLHEPK